MDRAWSHPVLTCAEAGEWEDGLLSDEAAEWAAMQQAAGSLAVAVTEDFKEIGGLSHGAGILVLVGKGHNGGDALLAAYILLLGRPQSVATVVLVLGEDSLRPLARRALASLRRDAPGRVEVLSADEALAEEARYELCFDGIFGFQFRPPLDPATEKLIMAVNAHPGIRLRAAVDLPSGAGEAGVGTVFRADFTYATGILKHAVLLPDLALTVGRLRYLDVGFFDRARWHLYTNAAGADLAAGRLSLVEDRASSRVLLRSILTPLAGLRSSQTDKRTFGHLLIVAGSRSYPGAVVLAVRAALRSGVGLVTAFVPERLVPEYAARHSEAMWVGCPETETGGLAAATVDSVRERLARATAVLMGPGLGAAPETLAAMQEIVRLATVPLVLDADALRPEIVRTGLAQGKSFICTPHAGEYERIGGRAGLRPARGDAMAVAVLKGPLTRILAETGRSDPSIIYYAPFGGPVLARGGSGDILAGLIGGLLAQGPGDPLLAACRGTVWHGHAADLLARQRGQVAVEISEILEQLGPALLS